jgi:hypothetical protein
VVGDERDIGWADEPGEEAEHAVRTQDQAKFAGQHEVVEDGDEETGDFGFHVSRGFIHEGVFDEFAEGGAKAACVVFEVVLFGGGAGGGDESDAFGGDVAEAFEEVGDGDGLGGVEALAAGGCDGHGRAFAHGGENETRFIVMR